MGENPTTLADSMEAVLHVLANLQVAIPEDLKENPTLTIDGKPVEIFRSPGTVKALQDSEEVFPILMEHAELLCKVGYALRYQMKIQKLNPTADKLYRRAS